MVDLYKVRADKTASAIIYPDLLSSYALVRYCPEFSVPNPPKREQPSSEENNTSEEYEDIDPDYRVVDVERNSY